MMYQALRIYMFMYMSTKIGHYFIHIHIFSINTITYMIILYYLFVFKIIIDIKINDIKQK